MVHVLHLLHSTTGTLGDFFANINTVKEQWWVSILHIQGPGEDKMDGDSNTQVNKSMISAFHADMYIPSSPLKG